jgi:outer membrane protein OmpA-like peptidoglycan-associated protein
MLSRPLRERERRHSRHGGPAALLLTLVGLVSLAAALTPGEARAQGKPRGALDQLEPSPAGDAFFALPSADVEGRVRVAAQLLASYAHDPLVLRHLSGGPTFDWVRDQALLHVQVSVEAAKRVKIDLDMPVTLAVGGTSGGLGNVMVTAPSGAGAADLRFGARVALLHQAGFVPAAALTFSLWAPIGNATSFGGAGVVRAQPGVSIGAEYAHLLWGASVGARFQPSAPNEVIGSEIAGGAGVAFKWAGLTVGPELSYRFDLGDQRNALVASADRAGAELLLGARYRLGPLVFGLGGGPGLGHALGTPTYRLLASVGAAFDVVPPNDPHAGDRRGGEGAEPAPPKPPPPPEGPLDTDGDGVPDAEDACPNVVGDATPGAYRRGCPADRDRDGIADAEDACPDVPGVESHDPAKNGCPLDSDGDGITDDKDACPYDKGPASANPKLNGCPTSVVLEGSQIVILQQVNFETGRAEIKKDSYGLLEQVAAVLAAHPEIARVAVDGHTDSQGSDKSNVNLSERRAIAVVRWLTEHVVDPRAAQAPNARGIDARRLEARGFGPRRPIADNKTDAGRAKNRRVEFQIRRRTDKGEAGWTDGPVEEAPK